MNPSFTVFLFVIIGLNISFQAKADVLEVKPKVAPTFGKVLEMAGTIHHIKPDQRMKRPGPEWFIEITSVDSKKLKKPVTIEFSRSSGEKKSDLKKDGLSLKIAAYEMGNFDGIPKNYYKYGSPWQDVGFHFRHEIVIVKILD